MSTYGRIVEDINIGRHHTYTAFVKYFGDPKMYKIKDVENWSMYMAKIRTMLVQDIKYIIAFVRKDFNPIKTEISLSNMNWEILQTRVLQDNHDIPDHSYVPMREYLYNVPITLRNKTEEEYYYDCTELGLNVTLLTRKKQMKQFVERGNVTSAIETYSTIFQF